MSTRNSSAGRNRFFDCFCVFAVTVISISALFLALGNNAKSGLMSDD